MNFDETQCFSVMLEDGKSKNFYVPNKTDYHKWIQTFRKYEYDLKYNNSKTKTKTNFNNSESNLNVNVNGNGNGNDFTVKNTNFNNSASNLSNIKQSMKKTKQVMI